MLNNRDHTCGISHILVVLTSDCTPSSGTHTLWLDTSQRLYISAVISCIPSQTAQKSQTQLQCQLSHWIPQLTLRWLILCYIKFTLIEEKKKTLACT